MDADRFDRVTRALATSSRRQLVRTGVAGLVAILGIRPVRQVAGSHLPLGDPCTTREDCTQVGGPVQCADNGIASDGALNCCHGNGGTCTRGAECCGDLVCTTGRCRPASSGGRLAPGALCQSTAQCSQVGGATVCADNGIAGDGALNCCRTEGGTCTSGAGCCGGLLCIGGTCQESSSGGLAPGAPCTTTEECSQEGGTTICADNGIASDGTLNCCREAAGPCSGNAGCCGDFVCADNGIASDGLYNCCHNAGGTCTSGADCCGALLCTAGRCQSP